MRERERKAAAVMGGVLGIGKRRFGKDWGRKMAIRQTGLDRWKLWSGDLGVEGKGGNRKNGREVSKVGVGGVLEHAGIPDKGGITEGESEKERRKKSMEL